MGVHPIKPCPNCQQDALFVTFKRDSLKRYIFRLNCPYCAYQSDNLPNVHPHDFAFPFGKHKGKTLSEIKIIEPDYLKWCQENLTDRWLVTKIEQFTRVKLVNHNFPPPSTMVMEEIQVPNEDF